ncbi:hypothetical protein ACN20G_33660 (plasmid) [Streptomyces sp. BI20]|uniref:hypothetical protein n=1 Tax=Streptomyces sp. BI20 TaxID=3403460 RepID=UPI003C74A3ED
MAQQPGPNWQMMTDGDFDTEAPLTLPVPSGPTRIPAAPAADGTPALFGEQPRPTRPEARRPGPPVEQEGLFE